MRFRISFNLMTRIVFTLLLAGPWASHVVVSQDDIRARMGWIGNVRIPRTSVMSIEHIERIPWWLGWGMHMGFAGVWAVNGSSTGAVLLTLRDGAAGRVLFLPVHPRKVYLSLEDPEGFIAAATPVASTLQS